MSTNVASPVKAAVDIAYLPPEKAGNKRIFPVPVEGAPVQRIQPVGALEQSGQTEEYKASSRAPTITNGQPATLQPGDANPDRLGFGFDGGSGGGLLQPPPQQPSAGAGAPTQAPSQFTPAVQPTIAPTQANSSAQAMPASAVPPTFEYKPVGSGLLGSAPTMTVPTVQPVNAQYQSVTGNAVANAPSANIPLLVAAQNQYKSVAQNAGPAPTATAVQSSFTPATFQKDGYTGVQGGTSFSYKPGAESLVENRVAGLLDPNNPIMRKAAAEAAQYAASRGLQSSTIGGEVALSTMIDKAMPIATQDANTFNQAQQLGWQQSWQSGENNLGRTHDASMADKQGLYQTNLQNTQLAAQAAENNANRAQQVELQQLQYKQSLGLLDAQGAQRMQELNAQQSFAAAESNVNRQTQGELQKLQYLQSLGQLDAQGQQRMQELNAQQQFQSAENNASRLMQAELQQLQYKQSLGQLDAQGQQRMQELNAQIQSNAQQQERSAQLQTQRDKLLQDMSNQTMDKQYLQQLQMTRVQYEQQDKLFMAQLNADTQMRYRNAVETAYNTYLQQVGAVWADPNMTAEQKSAGAAYLQSQLDAHRKSLETLYAVIGTPAAGSGSTTNPPTGTSNPNNPPMSTNPPMTTNPPAGGGNTGGLPGGGLLGGGAIRNPMNPDERLP